MRQLPLIICAIILTGVLQLDAQPQTLAIIGSSTSACLGPSDVNNCYVNRLLHYYDSNGNFDTSINNQFAVPGYSCFQGMPSSYISPYTNTALHPDPLHNITAALNLVPKPRAVLVNYPTNGYDTLPIGRIMFCLRTIRDSALAKGVPCYITTAQPRNDANFNNSIAKRKLADVKDSVLQEFGPFAIDFYTGLFNPADSSIATIYANGDGIHLNDAGHAVLFQRVLAKNVFGSNGPLPVVFVDFNAVYKQDHSNLISWVTSKEINVAHYEVLHSLDGINFTSITSINAGGSAGNSTYSYADKYPPSGWNYYKIAAVDKHAAVSQSPVFRVLDPGNNLFNAKVISQSAQLVLQIQNNKTQTLNWEIISSTGISLSKGSRNLAVGSLSIAINTGNFSAGIYFVKLFTQSGGQQVHSFIKN
jgi:hypothetical protein